MSCQHKNTAAVDPQVHSGATLRCIDCGLFFSRPDPFDVGRACMPLVRLLLKDGLSWSDREQVALAIQDNLRHHDNWQREKEHLASGSAGGKRVQ